MSQSEQWNFFSVSHDLQLEQSQHQSDVSSWRIKKRVGGSRLRAVGVGRGDLAEIVFIYAAKYSFIFLMYILTIWIGFVDE